MRLLRSLEYQHFDLVVSSSSSNPYSPTIPSSHTDLSPPFTYTIPPMTHTTAHNCRVALFPADLIGFYSLSCAGLAPALKAA